MFDEIFDYVSNTKALNTHTHHKEDDFFVDFDLDKLLRDTYISWSSVDFDDSAQSKQAYLDKVKYKSYFRYLQAALKQIYDIDEDLTAQTWPRYSSAISEKHENANWHKQILSDYCNYEKSILDAYWQPGSDNNHPELFSATFRIDSLFFGFDKEAYDHHGNNAYVFYRHESDNIDDYLTFVRDLIVKKMRSGSVSLKNAMAYDRNLRFKETTKQAACRVYENKNYSKADVAAFQDYFFWQVCDIAAEMKIPIQCHTGQGCMDNTRAIELREIIKANPKSTFVLFHAGFPWFNDILSFLHDCPNVYADICWLPLLSPTAAKETLHKLIEVGTADKVCWGCDTWTSEESFGARLALNETLADVLSSKISSGYLNMADAKHIAQNILYDNPKALYKL